MIDIGNDNLDNELYLEKNKYTIGIDPYDNNGKSKAIIFKNGELIDLRTEEDIKIDNEMFMNIKKQGNTDLQSNNNPKYLEYWRNIFPTKTDNELEEYRVKWSKDNPKYLKFERL